MEKWVPPDKRTVQMVLKDIQDDFAKWQHIYEYGSADPYWEDGFNLNLVRCHIINNYRLLQEKIEEQEQISMFEANEIGILPPVPPKMDDKWMCPTGEYPDRLERRKGNGNGR